MVAEHRGEARADDLVSCVHKARSQFNYLLIFIMIKVMIDYSYKFNELRFG